MDCEQDLAKARIDALRDVIDDLDDAILDMLEKRQRASSAIQKHKSEIGMSRKDQDREKEIFDRLSSENISRSRIEQIWKEIFVYE